ncbi:unnamed protein product [Candidula unifasciata]|uniref:Craniofacial development protein 1 n=1 Tax=Candidula unifasciata TaxID=100452 RepID=A0A8S3Z5Y1_9EUPU|nr:unnamed protein product [Candidula unifasciata]
MSDEEDYDSEEDLDYIPSEGEPASEEENSGDEEDLSLLKDDGTECNEATQNRKTKAKKQNKIAARRRKGGIKLEEKDNNAASEGTAQKEVECGNEEEALRKKELAEQIAAEEGMKKKEKEKKRADDLWSSFMADVKPPPSHSNPSATKVSDICVYVGSSNGVVPKTKSDDTGSARSGKVTITKIFDFAGEEIKVTEEVDANSKEAMAEQKKQEMATQEREESSVQPSPLPLGVAVKRPAVGGLGTVLSKISKKNKMGTLVSLLGSEPIDWDSFKKKEGIDDDLKIYNKGKQGYTERMAFLNRADQRQYEIERDIRLGSTSKR